MFRNKLYSVKLMLATIVVLLPASPARASMFEGETLDKLANILSWVVLVIAPAVFIVVFWLVHILPEKIAEKKHHPQAKAIQTLCLLSLFFGGILWPLAWLWAYTKPVLHKMAYGTDKVVHGDQGSDHGAEPSKKPEAATHENDRLRQRIVELEARLASKPVNQGGAA